jgi:hypothetical protein
MLVFMCGLEELYTLFAQSLTDLAGLLVDFRSVSGAPRFLLRGLLSFCLGGSMFCVSCLGPGGFILGRPLRSLLGHVLFLFLTLATIIVTWIWLISNWLISITHLF